MEEKIEVKYIKELAGDANQKIVDDFLKKHWSSHQIASKGKLTDTTKIPRVLALDNKGKLIGLVTYVIDNKSKSCEIITIDAIIQGQGVGTILLQKVESEARKEGCNHVWLITTNDNPEAGAFYVKKGLSSYWPPLRCFGQIQRIKTRNTKNRKTGYTSSGRMGV